VPLQEQTGLFPPGSKRKVDNRVVTGRFDLLDKFAKAAVSMLKERGVRELPFNTWRKR
jgi:hypothetical protein